MFNGLQGISGQIVHGELALAIRLHLGGRLTEIADRMETESVKRSRKAAKLQ